MMPPSAPITLLSSEELRGDVAARGAERAAQPDLAHALEHRDERDVGDPDRADEQRHAAEQHEERVEVVLDRSLAARAGSAAPTPSAAADCVGLSASGAWRAISSTAPTRSRSGPSAGACRPNSAAAVPSGMIIAPSSDGWRSTPARMPMTR